MKNTILILCLLFLMVPLTAQIEIGGKIKNQESETLAFASVYLSKMKIGAVSNIDGTFLIKISEINEPLIDTLIVSYIGYKTFKKKIYLKNDKNIKLSISMNSTAVNLKEIQITAKNYIEPEIIIKNAIKRTKENYSNETIQMDGFYREQMKENEKWIEVNEAAVQMKYAKYPQKHFTKRGFRQYYKDGFFTKSFTDVFMHVIYFPYYVSSKDELRIISSRTSLNHSVFSLNASPVGGPMDLVALDRIKYQYDFLDPKLLDNYTYQLKGTEVVNGENCYVVKFHPNRFHPVRVFQRYDKKMKYALYTGILYITINNFSIVKIVSQLANDNNFSIYKQYSVSFLGGSRTIIQ